MFNAQLFREMGKGAGFRVQGSSYAERAAADKSGFTFLNICLVPEWRVWKWPAIRRWEAPGGSTTDTTEQREEKIIEQKCAKDAKGDDCRAATGNGLRAADDRLRTIYLPVFYLPYIGRSVNWWFYYRAIMRRAWQSRPAEEGNLESGRARQPWRAAGHGEDGGLKGCVILASWLYPDAVAAARVARERDIPVWLRVHGSDRFHMKSRWRRRLILDAVRYAQGMICNCKAVKDDLVKQGVPEGKIHIVPNGVDTSLFRYRGKGEVAGGLGMQGPTCAVSATADKSGFRVQDQAISDPPSALNHSATVLFIANLVPIKGPDVLLRAFAEIIRGTKDPEKKKTFEQQDAKHAKGECVHSAEGGEESSSLRPLRSSVQNPRLLIIGGGPLRGKLERMAKELGIADRVHFLGNRPHEEIALWMNVADVLCLTSRSEGMPNVVVEALASGLPVVATAVGACPELLADEPAAKVCPREDVKSLSEALTLMLGTVIDREALVRRQQGRYSWRQQAETILALMNGGSPP